MYYSILDMETNRLLSLRPVSARELPMKSGIVSVFDDPVLKVGIFASAPIYITASKSQVEDLLKKGILRTGSGIGDIMMLDSYLRIENLNIVQLYDGVRVIGTDNMVVPANSLGSTK